MDNRVALLPESSLFDEAIFPWLRAAAEEYAGDAIRAGYAREADRELVVEGLVRAGMGYCIGRNLDNNLRAVTRWKAGGWAGRASAAGLAILGRGRPKRWGDHGLYFCMGMLWLALGYAAEWTATDRQEREAAGRFQQFADGWLRVLDSDREKMPRRYFIRQVTKKIRSPI